MSGATKVLRSSIRAFLIVNIVIKLVSDPERCSAHVVSSSHMTGHEPAAADHRVLAGREVDALPPLDVLRDPLLAADSGIGKRLGGSSEKWLVLQPVGEVR